MLSASYIGDDEDILTRSGRRIKELLKSQLFDVCQTMISSALSSVLHCGHFLLLTPPCEVEADTAT